MPSTKRQRTISSHRSTKKRPTARTPDTRSSSSPTVALLFLTKADHAHPDLWRAYLKGNEHRFRVFSHPYLPSSPKDPTPDGVRVLGQHRESFLHGTNVAHRARTQWGHLVNAYYALLDHAYKHAPEAVRFVFLSDTCVPVTTADEAYAALVQEPETTWMDAPRPKDEANRYDHPRSKVDRKPVAPKLRRAGIDRKHFFKHSGWFAPCRADVERLLAHRDAFQALNFVSAGDEHILSILKRASYARASRLRNRPTTYVHWDLARKHKWLTQKPRLWRAHDAETDPTKRKALWDEIQRCRHAVMHPQEWTTTVTKTNVHTFRRRGCLFARKVVAGCNVDAIRAVVTAGS